MNVSAALSLAGIGFDATIVKVFVDPSIHHNTLGIEAKGKFDQIELIIRNTQSASNPKTGYIVAMSVIKNLRDLTSHSFLALNIHNEPKNGRKEHINWPITALF